MEAYFRFTMNKPCHHYCLRICESKTAATRLSVIICRECLRINRLSAAALLQSASPFARQSMIIKCHSNAHERLNQTQRRRGNKQHQHNKSVTYKKQTNNKQRTRKQNKNKQKQNRTGSRERCTARWLIFASQNHWGW